MTFTAFENRWAKAQKAWNASGSTEHVRIIELGEDLYFAASDLIEALKDERDELAEELDNLRTALRDRWSSVLPKDGGE